MFANGSFFPLKSARRKATVTISAPLASSASRMASGEENFPVPMMSRERKIRPAMTSGWFESDIPDNLENLGSLSRREPCVLDIARVQLRQRTQLVGHKFLERVVRHYIFSQSSNSICFVS